MADLTTARSPRWRSRIAIGHDFGALFVVGTGDAANPTDVVFVRVAAAPPNNRRTNR